MKTIILLLFISTGFLTNAHSQNFKVKYISYKSETKDEMEGYTNSISRFKNSKITLLSKEKKLLLMGSDDAVIIRFFKEVPWNVAGNIYAKGMHYGDNSYYVQGTITKGNMIKLNIIYRNEKSNKVTDDIIIIYERIIAVK